LREELAGRAAILVVVHRFDIQSALEEQIVIVGKLHGTLIVFHDVAVHSAGCAGPGGLWLVALCLVCHLGWCALPHTRPALSAPFSPLLAFGHIDRLNGERKNNYYSRKNEVGLGPASFLWGAGKARGPKNGSGEGAYQAGLSGDPS